MVVLVGHDSERATDLGSQKCKYRWRIPLCFRLQISFVPSWRRGRAVSNTQAIDHALIEDLNDRDMNEPVLLTSLPLSNILLPALQKL